MKRHHRFLLPALISSHALLFSCRQGGVEAGLSTDRPVEHAVASVKQDSPVGSKAVADPVSILSRREVPILCYHQIRDWRPTDTRGMRDNIIPPDRFRAHLRALADSGYRSILPEQLFGYLTRGDSLPDKPVMISFDDGSAGQYHVAMRELERHGFRGVFYIMTVSIDRPNYMSASELRDLSDRGHVIASHSWDHKNVLKHDTADWRIQLAGSKERLERITSKPVEHFAYPYGLWDRRTIQGLQRAGYRTAVILSTARDSLNPLFTVRRVNVPGDWSPNSLLTAMRRSFR